MDNKERNITPEEAVILWHASRLDLSKSHEQAPEILKVQGSVIGTLGNFSASIGKAKSKKTFNVSAIVAAALKNGTVLNYTCLLYTSYPFQEVGQAVGCVEFPRQCDDVPAPARAKIVP